MEKRNKKAQLTLFIIIGIVIIVAAALILTFVRRPRITISPSEDPQTYMEECSNIALDEIEEKIFESNTYPDKELTNYILYKGQRIPYLCKASEFYVTCVPQDPMYVGRIRQIIQDYVEEKAENCFSNLVADFENKGYNVEEGVGGTEVIIVDGRISANINKKVTVSRGEETKVFESFKGDMGSPLYDLASLAQMIVNYESDFCEFDNLAWMKEDKEIKIDRFRSSDQSKIYTLTHRKSGRQIKFAVKTCVLPAGL